ncbi:4-carboxymuconolactone decarboxylase [Corynebacterium frankenforstense]|uniref:4-carboxymuconolactone decarboxylase n=1 Tax=Corynebacterium frankenforstense TaxID=1230998 RepID=UPI00254EF6FA|nr:4-carboxymuconolactone decarboxylase [Corynebacterium frankenforstense]MDK6259370.1 4-carboxymuconolactone decarboxylase [Corynebacterium frankenforstense]
MSPEGTDIPDDDAYRTGREAAYEAGMRMRRQVLGDAHVDRALTRQSPVTEKFQDFITRTAWGDIWNRGTLDETQRRLLTIAILTAVGNDGELDMHLRAALRAGVSADTLGELLLHTAIYAGVPNSNHAFKLLDAAVNDAE